MFKQVKNIIFDFDGVLCHDFFYHSLKETHPEIHNYVESEIFGGKSDIVDRWMRNSVSSDDINKMISENCSIGFDEIKNIFEKDVLAMRIDNRLLDFAKEQKKLGKKIGLATNNMDVFTKLTIGNHSLDKIFEHIVNSSDYGIIKTDNNGKLFDILMDKMGESEYAKTLLIDDSKKVEPAFKAKKGVVYRYDNFENLMNWVKDNS